jgi:hypothetical protein
MTTTTKVNLFLGSIGLIMFATMYDMLFAILHARDFTEWELNPAAVWVYKQGGIGLVCFLKLLSLFFFVAIMTTAFVQGKKIALPAVVLVAAIYSLLMLYYLWSFIL